MNAQELQLDYFKIYDVFDHRVEHWVALQGQFDDEPEKAELMVLSHFGNPASKNQEPMHDRNAHFSCYRLYQPLPDPMRMVELENQFGKQRIITGSPAALLAPAQKRERGSRFPEKLDHYKLYRVLRSERLDKEVALEDQFGREEARVLYPILFGAPVHKEFRDQISPIYNDRAHLLIYRIVPRRVRQSRIVRDQFGRRYLTFMRSVALAVPGLKREWKELDQTPDIG